MKSFSDNNWSSVNNYLHIHSADSQYPSHPSSSEERNFLSFKGWASLAKVNPFSLVNCCFWSNSGQWDRRKCLLEVNKGTGNQFLFPVRQEERSIWPQFLTRGELVLDETNTVVEGKEIWKEHAGLTIPEASTTFGCFLIWTNPFLYCLSLNIFPQYYWEMIDRHHHRSLRHTA